MADENRSIQKEEREKWIGKEKKVYTKARQMRRTGRVALRRLLVNALCVVYCSLLSFLCPTILPLFLPACFVVLSSGTLNSRDHGDRLVSATDFEPISALIQESFRNRSRLECRIVGIVQG